MNKFIISITFLFILNRSYSQEHVFYIKFKEDKISLNEIRDKALLKVKVSSSNKKIENFLNGEEIIKIEKPYVGAGSEFLEAFYKITCTDKNLVRRIKSNFSTEISQLDTIQTPVLLNNYLPNDYSLTTGTSHFELIGANKIWGIIKDIPKATVAITDSYFEVGHEDFNGQYLTVLGLNTSTVGFAYHGTQVAGLIGALSDNNIGIASIGYNTKIAVSSNYGSDDEVLRLAMAGYRIINCSWFNSCSPSTRQQELYRTIRDTWNTVVVFGAGNHPSHCGSNVAKVYPASYESVLSISSVGHVNPYGYIDPTYGKAGWKDLHEDTAGDTTATHHHNDAVDLVAPGYNVPTTRMRSEGNYGGAWGTSYAAPIVAAAAGVIRSVNPCLTAKQTMDILKRTADASIYNIPENMKYEGKLGTGRLDVYKAVREAVTTKVQNTTTPSFSINTNGTFVDIGSNVAPRPQGPVVVSAGTNWSISGREVFIKNDFEAKLGSEITITTSPTFPLGCYYND